MARAKNVLASFSHHQGDKSLIEKKSQRSIIYLITKKNEYSQVTEITIANAKWLCMMELWVDRIHRRMKRKKKMRNREMISPHWTTMQKRERKKRNG
jgi:hypothetical protein